MVQVSRRSCIGKIKYCHTHDLLWDLAIHKAKEDNFLTVLSKNDIKLNSSTCARRLALHGYGNKLKEHACTNLRSLINFGDVTNFNRFGMLRVLHIRKESTEVLLHGTNCLKGLKYLAIEDERIYNFPCNKLPSTCGFLKRSPLTYMNNLQTVSRRRFCRSQGEWPASFWGNKQLRHINVTCCAFCNAPEGPPSATDLQSLLTLKGVRARQEWVIELPNFPYIRELKIFIPEDVAGEELIKLLSNLNHLGSLYLVMKAEKSITFPDCISAFSNHNRLHSFRLYSGGPYHVIWPRKEVGGCVLYPPHLVKLILDLIIYEEDPMPQLEKLTNLRVLRLRFGSMEAAEGKQMICSRGGFGHLQRLMLLDVRYLKEWKIEEGAMPMLNQLKLSCDLEIFPDLQYLVNLQEFTVPYWFQSRLEGEDQWKIKHIPSVKIW